LDFFFATASTHGAWFIQYPDATNTRIQLSDKQYEFDMDGIQCSVQKTEFLRAPDDSVSELREMGCWLKEGSYVYIYGNCQKPYYQFNQMGIKTQGKTYVPTLTCGPAK
jgi:hypothetical protein